MRKRIAALLLSVLGLVPLKHLDDVQAAESGLGFYLLGSKTSMAGFVPPPGTYLADIIYFYAGNTDINFNIGGVDIFGGIDADAYIKLLNGLWVAPEKVLGGHAAFSVAVPIGWKNVSARASTRADWVSGSRLTTPMSAILSLVPRSVGTRATGIGAWDLCSTCLWATGNEAT